MKGLDLSVCVYVCLCVHMYVFRGHKKGECTVEKEKEIKRERGDIADLEAEEGEEGGQTKRETEEGSGEEK